MQHEKEKYAVKQHTTRCCENDHNGDECEKFQASVKKRLASMHITENPRYMLHKKSFIFLPQTRSQGQAVLN